LLLGAGGFIGLNTLDALRAAHVEPRCGRRRRSNVLGLRQRSAQLVEADLEQPATLREAMTGCHTVVHLAGHYPRLSNTPDQTVETGLRQTQATLDAAACAGVKRFIYVSSTATVARRLDGASDESHIFTQAPNFGTYHLLKWSMEERVARERRFETVTLCPGACLGAFDWKIGTSAMLWSLLRGQAPQYPDGIVSWVDARDVGAAIATAVQMHDVPRRILLAAASVNFRDLLRAVARRYPSTPLGEPLSPSAARALADDEEARAAKSGGRPRLAREIVDLIVHGAVLDTRLSKQALRQTYRPLEQTLMAFESWAKALGAHIPTQPEVHR
jgi:dihydroflavonol-4-reductase